MVLRLFLLVCLSSFAFAQSAEYQDTLDRALRLKSTGDYQAAAEACAEAHGIEPTYESLRERGHCLFLNDGTEKDSIAVLKAAHRLGEKSGVDGGGLGALLLLAQAKLWVGRPGSAHRNALEYVRARPGDVDAALELASSFFDLENYSRVESLVAPGLTEQPDHPWLRGYRGLARWHGAGVSIEGEESIDDLRSALREPEFERLYGDVVGHVETVAGDAGVGLELARQAVEADPRSGYAHLVLALALRKLGRDEEAEVALGRAAELDDSFVDYGEDELGDLSGEYDIFDPEAVTPWGAYGPFVIWFAAMCVLGLLMTPAVRPQTAVPARPNATQPFYDGPPKELLRVYLQNVVMTLMTLGVFRFWAKVITRRFHYQHTEFAGGRFDYHATGREKFVGFVKGLLILSPLAGAAYFVSLQIPGESVEAARTDIAIYIFFLLLFTVRPLILVGTQRFNLRRTSWSNLRLHFSGKVKDAYALYGLDLVRLIVTLGLYWPWHTCRVRRFRMQHTCLGTRSFDFRGDGVELFGIQLFGTVLSMLTLGIYSPWYFARKHLFFTRNTTFEGRRLRSDLRGSEVLSVAGTGGLATVLTLGLALPWAVTRWRRLLTHTTYFVGEFDASELESIRLDADGTAEGLGEAGDLLGEIGDLLGV